MSEFRFGVTFTSVSSREGWLAKFHAAEAAGFDVIGVSDHLGGRPAPWPVLTLAAQVTRRPRLGTFVLNAGFYSPALLAREVATVDELTNGRVELGIGTGYVRAEFEAAGLPFPTASERIDGLERTLDELEHLLDGDTLGRARPPLLIGGNGDRMLRLAARRADIVGLSAVKAATSVDRRTMVMLTSDELEERCEFVGEHSAHRAHGPELNLVIQNVVVTDDRLSAAQRLRATAPETTTVEQILDSPSRAIGTASEIAHQLRSRRERFGISYITVLESALDAFAPVITLLRQ